MTVRSKRRASVARDAGSQGWSVLPRSHGGRWALVLALLGTIAVFLWRVAVPARTEDPGRTHATGSPDARYVGASTCAPCHKAEFDAWTGSHHAQAMQVAGAGTVLGDFDDATLEYAGITTTFSSREGSFFVRTDGAGGRLQDFKVTYTFGVSPLQQYLVEMPDGRIQALPIAWDTRPTAEGGQRWFHLYPGERIDHTDELHWTGRHQTWNFMCADCHSTNVRKGYDAARDRFETTWSEINVACEACHGPGSRHVDWANASPWRRRLWGRDNGLIARLTERDGAQWIVDPGTLVPRRTPPRTTNVEIDVCAQCHSRREQISEQYYAGAPLQDAYVPAVISRDLYHPDGQQREEVYTYGSFLQSRMSHAGVTCSDCHDPHTQRLRAPGNRLCATCHVPARYDTPAHHFHPAEDSASRLSARQCVSCHMPATTYMVIDSRRDHSIRIPRPDRTVSLGVPNACNGCHRDRTAQWAVQQLRTWYRRAPAGFQTFAETFHAADNAGPDSATALARLASDSSHPAIVRASALERLASRPGQHAIETARTQLEDRDPSVRRAALAVFETVPPAERVRPVAPLLRDPVKAVRLQAAWLLAPAAAGLSGSEDGQAFARASAELVESRRYKADRPEDRTMLGFFFAQLGRREEAIAEYRAAVRLWPRFVPAYVNLGDLYGAEGLEKEAEATIRAGLAVVPDDPTLHHALGLSLARAGRRSEALEELKRAAELSDDPRFAYAYAVGLHSAGREADAIATLERARTRDPHDRDVLFALATFHRDAGRTAKALEYAVMLEQFHPEDPEAQALVASLRTR